MQLTKRLRKLKTHHIRPTDVERCSAPNGEGASDGAATGHVRRRARAQWQAIAIVLITDMVCSAYTERPDVSRRAGSLGWPCPQAALHCRVVACSKAHARRPPHAKPSADPHLSRRHHNRTPGGHRHIGPPGGFRAPGLAAGARLHGAVHRRRRLQRQVCTCARVRICVCVCVGGGAFYGFRSRPTRANNHLPPATPTRLPLSL